MEFRTLFDGKQKQVSEETGLYTDPETAQFAQQSDKDACDINLIIERFQRTGLLPEAHAEGFYADITALQGPNAYMEALQTVQTAQRAFNVLPGHIRAMFGNNPAAFLDAMDKKQFTQEMVDAGLVEIIEAAPHSSGSDKSDTVADQLIQKVEKA